MAEPWVPAELVEEILFAGPAGRRFVQDSPVLPDVWLAYAARPGAVLDLLVTPRSGERAKRTAPELAHLIAARLGWAAREPPQGAGSGRLFAGLPEACLLAPLEGFVAVQLDFASFRAAILPLCGPLAESAVPPDRAAEIRAGAGRSPRATVTVPSTAHLGIADKVAVLADLIARLDRPVGRWRVRPGAAGTVAPAAAVTASLPGSALAGPFEPLRWSDRIPVWRVALNRRIAALASGAAASRMVSTATIKADAARTLFAADCAQLVWGVIDSGIDAAHPAFTAGTGEPARSRVIEAYDFSRLRETVAYDRLEASRDRILALLAAVLPGGSDAAAAAVRKLVADAREARPYDWSVLQHLVRIAPDTPPAVDHGTHVAGILAGDWPAPDDGGPPLTGVCPDLRLVDLRVLSTLPDPGRADEVASRDMRDDVESALLAAMEFVRWRNSRNRYLEIHGVNMSVGLPHDAQNFACGHTPVCRAATALVEAGVVVVAAAGNNGRVMLQDTRGQRFESSAASSITDPGNAEDVITVGSTHRDRPHDYGTSYFSSRGPTGDGRAKPDLLAPGERISGPLPGGRIGELDGTSMAAPHVSGAAALLMARHKELVGRPRRIKQLLMAGATDLGRERSFQGAGLVDVLRTLQAV